jgi:hypothetical protein
MATMYGDIVKRLRDAPKGMCDSEDVEECEMHPNLFCLCKLYYEAADEIERLRTQKAVPPAAGRVDRPEDGPLGSLPLAS